MDKEDFLIVHASVCKTLYLRMPVNSKQLVVSVMMDRRNIITFIYLTGLDPSPKKVAWSRCSFFFKEFKKLRVSDCFQVHISQLNIHRQQSVAARCKRFVNSLKSLHEHFATQMKLKRGIQKFLRSKNWKSPTFSVLLQFNLGTSKSSLYQSHWNQFPFRFPNLLWVISNTQPYTWIPTGF